VNVENYHGMTHEMITLLLFFCIGSDAIFWDGVGGGVENYHGMTHKMICSCFFILEGVFFFVLFFGGEGWNFSVYHCVTNV